MGQDVKDGMVVSYFAPEFGDGQIGLLDGVGVAQDRRRAGKPAGRTLQPDDMVECFQMVFCGDPRGQSGLSTTA
jgi:hypothetical protein